MKTLATILLCAAIAAVGCGGEDTAPRRGVGGDGKPAAGSARPAAKSKPKAAPKAAAPAKKKGKTERLVIYEKVPAELRRVLGVADFQPDATGDINRDPFFPFFAQVKGAATNPPPSATARGGPDRRDECRNRTVAGSVSLRDLRLIGIVLRGTRSYALFRDNRAVGHWANRGDCLGKDLARVKDVGNDRVIIEVQGDPPPTGGAAPEPREEVILLHPKELELTEEELGETGAEPKP